jgi:N-glycosidase YbiA
LIRTTQINEFRGTYRWLSNFHLTPIEFEGIVFPSTEHAYQAAKTEDMDVRRYMAGLIKPAEAMRYGRSFEARKDWDLMKVSIMNYVNREKYKVRENELLLLGTGDAPLYEGNRWGDHFWGVDYDELIKGNVVGQNNLGKILMQIRQEKIEEWCL